MAIYIGRDGVVREAASAEGGVLETRHATDCMINLDGTARHCMDWTSELDHVEIAAYMAQTWKVTSASSSYELVAEGLEELNKHGTITVTQNSLTLRCTGTGYDIRLYGRISLVFKDGHRVSIRQLKQAVASLKFTVGYALGARGDGYYVSTFAGQVVVDVNYNNYLSGTTEIDLGMAPYNEDAYLDQEMVGSGYGYVTQTYQGCTIGGKSFPIKVVNNLT